MPTKEEIKNWLKGIGKDRFWLADKCGVEKVSVDGWFTSRGRVPSYALLVIQNLMKTLLKLLRFQNVPVMRVCFHP